MVCKMKGKGSGWRNESRRHSLARKGIRTIHFGAQGKNMDYSKWLQKVNITKEEHDKIIRYITAQNNYDYADFIGHSRLILNNKLHDIIWKQTGNYPDRSIQRDIHDFIQSLDLDSLINYGAITVFKINDGEEYPLAFGSNIRNPSGTHSRVLGSDDLLVLSRKTPNNTYWFIYKGERGKHTYGAYSGIDFDERLMRLI